MPSKKKKSEYIPKRQNPNQARSTRSKRKQSVFLTWLLIFSAAGLFVVPTALFIVNSMNPHPAPVYAIAPIPVPIPTPTPAPTSPPRFPLEPSIDPMEGLVHSPLTGLPIPEEIGPLRPVAVVVNNHSRALPQSGIIDAELIYEVLSEGNITRLVAIHHELEAPMIGPVRSTRDYFADFAMDNDAIFAHHGGSPSGYVRLHLFNVDNLDGMALEGTTFWRDPERFRIPMLIEHSSFTSAERLESTIYNRNIRRERFEDDGIGFTFNQRGVPFEEIAMASGGQLRPCWALTVPFSVQYPRTFVYDPETMTYAAYNVHGPHIDRNIEDENEAQVRVTNILIQLTRMRVVDGDGRREVVTVGGGYGYLVTKGGIVNVRWTRASHDSPTRWFFMNGEPVILNPGQTWICVLADNLSIEVVTEAPELDEEIEETDE